MSNDNDIITIALKHSDGYYFSLKNVSHNDQNTQKLGNICWNQLFSSSLKYKWHILDACINNRIINRVCSRQ